MATSSIFTNVKIDNPEKADAFVTALEASIHDPLKGSGRPTTAVNANPDLVRTLIDRNLKKRGLR